MYLYGEPGIGKSHSVRTILEEYAEKDEWITYQLYKGTITPKGLFQVVKDNPYSILVFDDGIDIKNDAIRKLLLSMLETSPTSYERVVKWVTNKGEDIAKFNGAIIIISNHPVPKDKHGIAIGSRIQTIHYKVTHQEIVDIVKNAIKDGFRGLTYDEIAPYANQYSKLFKNTRHPFDVRRFLDRVVPHIEQYKLGLVNATPEDFIIEMFNESIELRTSLTN